MEKYIQQRMKSKRMGNKIIFGGNAIARKQWHNIQLNDTNYTSA